MRRGACLLLIAFSTSCSLGYFEDGPAGPSVWPAGAPAGEGGAPSPGPSQSFECDPGAMVDPGPSPLQRLTTAQYAAIAEDLFGKELDLTDVLPAEADTGHIGLAQADVSQVEVERYGAAARRIAEYVEAKATQFAPCKAPTDESSARLCAQSMLGGLGTRIYRAPLEAPDAQQLIIIFSVGFKSGGYAHGISLMVRAMLQSPRFLYRPEFGLPATGSEQAIQLSAYELASRLSFAFWNRGPDAELLAAAASGELLNESGLSAQTDRLLADPRARTSFRDFFRIWFGLNDLATTEKDPKVFPQWSEQARQQLVQQGDAFLDAVLFADDDDSFERLFSLDPKSLAPDAMSEWTQSGPGAAVGVLALPALLTTHSKPTESFPIYRGLFVREQLLCQPLPAPPSNVGDPPAPQPGVRGRERFEQHSVDPACRGCHQSIDPLGFAFENYDAIGRYRATEEGSTIDASGELVGTDVDGHFENLAELSERLGRSETVRACTTRQWFRFVMQRYEQPSDDCSMKDLNDAFAASGNRLAALRRAIVKTSAFRMRRVIADQEASP